ncbi:MAG: chorismate-binding protein [Victivallaceae bacterium]|nr:chorismate-binding protein [Victivallaceae bacterium]
MRRPGTALVPLPGGADIFSAGLFLDPETVISAGSTREVAAAFAALEELLAGGYCAAGFVTYEAAPAFDAGMVTAPDDGSFPLLEFACYRNPPRVVRLPYLNDYALESPPMPELDGEAYAVKCHRVLENIVAGNIYQANLTFRAGTGPEPEPERLFLNLFTRHPVPCAAYLNLSGDRKVLSLSPELYLECADGVRLTSSPMKGTAKRLPRAEADRAAALALAADPKNRAENLMITDMVRNDLGRIARCGTVKVDPLFHVDTYNTVHQMISTVHAELPEQLPLFDIFRASFPPASITGAPKVAAMKLLAQLEESPRRIYTGAVGCVLPGRRFRFNVAIRTLICLRDRMETGVGGGVVCDSTPDSEWNEALLKSRYATCRMPDFEVFETLGWNARDGFCRLEKHVRRAVASQRYFCRGYVTGNIERALAAKEPELAGNPVYHDGACVKFRLGYGGEATVEISPPRKPDWHGLPLRLLLSRDRTSSQDVYLYHKTTNREFYDSRLTAAKANGFHEVIFMNENGELTEGAVSSLFIRKGDRWLTPAPDCGLLPGVWRAERLAALNAVECVLGIEDLRTADEVIVGNSLRGTGWATVIVDENGGDFIRSFELPQP